MKKVKINSFERIDDLQTKNNLMLIQNPDWFCFGVDAVLLSHFASKTVKKGAEVLDLCTGNGIVPILMSEKTDAEKIVGLEIQEAVAEMAERSVSLNDLDEKVFIQCGDLKNAEEIFGKEKFDNITCNPPYKEATGGLKNSSDTVTIARHEVMCNLRDIIEVSAKCLKPYGKLCMVHRPERLADIICLMRENRIEPKRLWFIHPKKSKTANIILIEGAKYGKPKLFLEPPLYVYDENGEYSKEIDEIYGRIKPGCKEGKNK
ncbi:MAG: tRNA1(Val) (adenine(37)-N6)-methyltransferase [Clostridia bacterium]|nr:tRNA1(Val) (adenine(37)-N6)-methyltransferase [Clostridia bacterium]